MLECEQFSINRKKSEYTSSTYKNKIQHNKISILRVATSCQSHFIFVEKKLIVIETANLNNKAGTD